MAEDAGLTIDALRALTTDAGRRLLAEAAQADAGRPADVASLRRGHSAEVVHAALTLAAVQKKALGPKGKFRAFAGRGVTIFAPPEALEQASSLRVAWHKARRIDRVVRGAGGIIDVAAGVGGDAVGLAAALPVVAVERSYVRAWCLAQNARQAGLSERVLSVCGEAERLPVRTTNMFFHLDPARRTAGRRHHGYADLVPGPAVIEQLIGRLAGGAIKLSPGVRFEELPEGRVELISEGGTVVQAVLWTGALAAGDERMRTATVLPMTDDAAADVNAAWSMTAEPEEDAGAAVEPEAYLYEVDGAVHRAQLAAALARDLQLAPANDDGGYLTGPRELSHPALAGFRVVETMAWSEKRVGEALRRHRVGDGPVEIKTRGNRGVDTDALQKRLSRVGSGLTVLIYAAGGRGVATLAQRLP